jgi:transposase, IS5 family
MKPAYTMVNAKKTQPGALKMREKQSTNHELFDTLYQHFSWSVDPKNPTLKMLQAMDRLLDEVPEILALVLQDMSKAPAKNKKGIMGRPPKASAEQILRSAILMQLMDMDYRQLADEVGLNLHYRWFTRFYDKKIPHFTTLNDLIKMISETTMARINEAILGLGIKKNVEDGKAMRIDTMVTETNIIHPCDSRLLGDSVRVLIRTLKRLRAEAPNVTFAFHNHAGSCKKLAYQIAMGKGKDIAIKQAKWYGALLNYQQRVRGYACEALKAFVEPSGQPARIEIEAFLEELRHFLPLAEQVYTQAYRRVVLGEKVPADEKLLSIFETHTDLICRGKKGSKAEFGHKIAVSTGRSGMVVFYETLDGNPGDNESLPVALKEHERLMKRAPERLTGDRRFHSKDNEEIAAEAGVKQVALPKPGFLTQTRAALQKMPWFRKLMRFRAGIEGNLSTLLRSFKLKRCLWRGWESFQAYVGLSVLAYNLRLLAGHVSAA